MLTFVSVVHVILCVFMIFVILLQPGKEAGMGSALGGGAATSAFGGRGAVTFLTKLTAFCAIAFFLTSLGLSFVGMKTSVTSGIESSKPAAAPVSATPEAAPAAPAVPAASSTEAGPKEGDLAPIPAEVQKAPGTEAPAEKTK